MKTLVPEGKGLALCFLLQLAHDLSCAHTYGWLNQANYCIPRVVSTAGSACFSLTIYPVSLLRSTQTLTLLLP